MADLILPNNKEVNRWILDAVKHSFHVEYYLDKLKLGSNDLERPHDLVGEYNKLDWEVLRGLSLTYRNPRVDFESQILPSIELHRGQHHHQMWNKYNAQAKEEDLLVGAVDAACSLLEKRVYLGGKEQRKLGKEHDWDGVIESLQNNDENYKIESAKKIVPQMMEIPEPNLDIITSLNNLPNIGVSKEIYQKIKDRVDEVSIDLANRGYNILG